MNIMMVEKRRRDGGGCSLAAVGSVPVCGGRKTQTCLTGVLVPDTASVVAYDDLAPLS